MVVNFRAREINRGIHKLTEYSYYFFFLKKKKRCTMLGVNYMFIVFQSSHPNPKELGMRGCLRIVNFKDRLAVL
jgi:hypothetical protein